MIARVGSVLRRVSAEAEAIYASGASEDARWQAGMLRLGDGSRLRFVAPDVPGGLIDTETYLTEEPIEEPVTSGGDSGLWLSDEEDEDEEEE
jgi:hypothetical protein